MADPRLHRRARLALASALSIALLGAYWLVGGSEDDESGNVVTPFDASDEGERLEVVEVSPGDPTPGSALEIRYTGGNAKGVPLRAGLSIAGANGSAKHDLEVLHRRPGEMVVRIPDKARPGRAKLRIQHGDDEESRSKPYDLRVKSLSRRKLFRSVLGGIALLVLGLRTMSRGTRAYTGHRSQGVLASIGRRTPAAVGVGVLLGGLTQFTTTAAGLVVSLIESHLLAVGPAAAILLGAQLGSAAAPSLIGLASNAREGLLVVSLGVLWLGFASDRRSKALANIILGCGLLFYGLHLLRIGFEPLVSDPELLPYIDRLQTDDLAGRLGCVLAGIVLAALLQGPGPVFGLVLSLAQASGRIDLQSAVAILAGTGMGAALGTIVVAWPFGPEARRLARLHLLLAIGGTIFLAATVNVWAYLADMLVAGRPGEMAYGKKVLLPHIGRHLVLAFMLSQGAATLLLTMALRVMLRRARPGTTGAKTQAPLSEAAAMQTLRDGLGRVIAVQRRALASISELCLGGDRAKGMDAEHALADARGELERVFTGSVRTRSEDMDLGRLRQGALGMLQLQRALEDLLGQAERSTERALALSNAGQAWHVAPEDERVLKALHDLLGEGLDTVALQLSNGTPPDVDQARSREIRMNGLELETRQRLLTEADGAKETRGVALRLNTTDVVNAYEAAGNQLYRLCEALASEVDQDAIA